MIIAFFLASPHKDYHNFILLKKQCMLQYSDNAASMRIYSWNRDVACKQCGSLFQHAIIIITVDATVA
jgi:hypothetical protein